MRESPGVTAPGPFVAGGEGRGQTTLAALAVALVLLTAVTTGSVVVADRELAAHTSDPLERRRADRAAAALVTDSPLATGRRELAATAVNETNASTLAAAVPALRGADFRVRVDGETVAARGTPEGGAAVTRSVALVTTRTETRTIDLDGGAGVTFDGRTGSLRLVVSPGDGTTVRTVRVGDRVALHRATGLEGVHTVTVSTYAPPAVQVELAGTNVSGTVTAEADVEDKRPTTLTVVVDA